MHIVWNSHPANMVLMLVTALISIQMGCVSLATVYIDTGLLSLELRRDAANETTLFATSQERNFIFGNKTWKYQVAVYQLKSPNPGMFADGNEVVIKGNRSIVIQADFDITVNTTINVSAVAVSTLNGSSHLGGFALASKNCCFVGAGPGAGFTFHGGGHGGGGGGSWVDTVSGVSYGKSYELVEQVVGGSSGAFVYDSDPGSGGGAISFEVRGTLTIGSKAIILADGYNIRNTSHQACSGGSAGGRILVNAHKVNLHGKLSAKGGHGGKTSNYSDYCGDGGGGGLIHIRSFDSYFSDSSVFDLKGGRGLEDGKDGIFRSVALITGVVKIETTQCRMAFLDLAHDYIKFGKLSSYQATIGCREWKITTCTFHFERDVEFAATSTVSIAGKYALKIVAKSGDIVISTKFDLSMQGKIHPSASETFLGGYSNLKKSSPGPGSNLNKGSHGFINGTSSYGIWPPLLIGGSSCKNAYLSLAFGGGALCLEANNGSIVINANISADAYSGNFNRSCGASGGTIILNATSITWNAYVTANGCDGELAGGDGGVIAASEMDSKAFVSHGDSQHGSGKGNSGSLITLTSAPQLPHQTKNCSSSEKKKDGVSNKFRTLVGVVVNSTSAERISKSMVEAARSSSVVTFEDTILLMNLIGQICNSSIYRPKNSREGKTIATNIVSTCSKIARLSFESSRNDSFTQNLVPRMTSNLEVLGESISMVLKTNETFLVEDDSIAMEVTNFDGQHPRERSFPISPLAINSESNVTIPKEVFSSLQGNLSVILVVVNTSSTYSDSIDTDGSPVQAASSIIAVKLNAGKLSSLPEPITLRHRLTEKPSKNVSVRGGFWKSKSRYSQEGWSYEGCTSKEVDGFVETKSSHMTSFAVLLSVTKQKIPEHHKIALSFITYIGCGISLFGLLLTLATFITLDNLDPERTAIHTNLVISLGIGQIIYLSGINATDNKAACTTVAVLLHYFFTAAFSWMFAEGIHLYKKIVSVFSHGSKIKFYYIIGWGLPVIIVSLSAGIRPDGYGTESACWISIEAGLIWAFVAPVAIIIIINFVILVIVVKILMSSVSTVQVDSKTSQETNKSVQQIRAGAKAMVILIPILGLSWIFGILAVNEAAITFQYLFCIFNSLQGLFIFLIHCVGNSEVRSAFKRLHERHTLSKSVGDKSVGARSTKKSKNLAPGAEILVRRETGSSLDSHDGGRAVTPKTLSAGQISLNSLNCPTPVDDFAKFE